MSKSFDDFISTCNDKAKTKYFPELVEAFKKSNENLLAEKGTVDYSTFITSILDLSCNFANDISLLHIEDYHKWLFQNYNITLKE